MFVMIGADPCTEMVEGMLGVDPAGYLVCGKGAAFHEGPCRWPLSDRDARSCSRPSGPESSPRATCARVRPSASRVLSATARSRSASSHEVLAFA